jgi:hypothetical protein
MLRESGRRHCCNGIQSHRSYQFLWPRIARKTNLKFHRRNLPMSRNNGSLIIGIPHLTDTRTKVYCAEPKLFRVKRRMQVAPSDLRPISDHRGPRASPARNPQRAPSRIIRPDYDGLILTDVRVRLWQAQILTFRPEYRRNHDRSPRETR